MPKAAVQKKPSQTRAAESAPVGSREQYDHWLPLARRIPAAEVRPMRADLSLVITNATRGAGAVLTRADEVQTALPKVSLALVRNLGALGSAVQYAAGQVDVWAPPPSDLRARLQRATALRALLMTSADALAAAGAVNPQVVKNIHAGHGFIDMAGDLVALSDLFTKNAAKVRGKAPFTAADVREAGQLGADLLNVLRPKRARSKPAAKELADAVDARDRLWTLFETTWEDHVWRAGAWLWKRAMDGHVPPLQSHVAAKRTAKATKAGAAKTDGGGGPAA